MVAQPPPQGSPSPGSSLGREEARGTRRKPRSGLTSACQRSPGHISSFQALGFFLSMREVPSLLQGALTLLAKAGKGRCVSSRRATEALHSPQHDVRVCSPRRRLHGQGLSPGWCCPGEGLHAAAQLAFPQETLPARAVPLSELCSSQIPCIYMHSNVILADPY